MDNLWLLENSNMKNLKYFFNKNLAMNTNYSNENKKTIATMAISILLATSILLVLEAATIPDASASHRGAHGGGTGDGALFGSGGQGGGGGTNGNGEGGGGQGFGGGETLRCGLGGGGGSGVGGGDGDGGVGELHGSC